MTRKASESRPSIVGMGPIGETIAQRAAAFDMPIRDSSRQLKQDLLCGFEPSSVKLATWAGALIVGVLGREETQWLIDADILRALGHRGLLINVGRGSADSEVALIQTLASGGIRGAGLDVFADEPRVPKELQGLPNVVLTPHIARSMWQPREVMSQLVVENVRAFELGQRF
ncbi:NAD(P)-dependent oxidoreductase [Paeniglutamicibacter terrestris]|uniref:D-isomer specific 2-hydroxyacid dehydrogenase NAD-binding domain-containing protein n=1 Tax=Paeniglutamicibacter terrestris TaxID=2723403 RepID=A0ABX1G8L0_9MICC|nr:NAD(P)-dependent oxidoreductase [Paeniglutamicibacter terrestris]NKG22588.1 hypothetical protein [Paeniglutamicibacter terrestris]